MSLKEVFKALNDETRRKILLLLKENKMLAGDISSPFSITEATVSHHLSILKDAGLVRTEKKGKFVFYELNTTVLEDVIIWLQNIKED